MRDHLLLVPRCLLLLVVLLLTLACSMVSTAGDGRFHKCRGPPVISLPNVRVHPLAQRIRIEQD